MKSRTIFSLGLLLIVSMLMSCNKDKNSPVITLLGSDPMFHCIGNEYVDPGATAYDEEDGDITDKINTTINVNTEVEGAYTVLYSVEDKAGNAATATRTVDVIYCK